MTFYQSPLKFWLFRGQELSLAPIYLLLPAQGPTEEKKYACGACWVNNGGDRITGVLFLTWPNAKPISPFLVNPGPFLEPLPTTGSPAA